MKILKILLYLSCFNFIYCADLIDISLKDFIIQVAKDKDITILIDKKVEDNLTLTISNKIRRGDYLNALKMVLEDKDLELIKKTNIYYIQNIKKYRIIKINFVKFDDIKDLFDDYDAKIKYIKNTNSLLVHSSLNEYKKIMYLIKNIDIVPFQKKLKITIINTNLNHIKEKGFNNDFNFKTNGNFYFNLLAYPFTVTNQLSNNAKASFYSYIKFLNQEGYTNLLSSPTLTILDDKETLFQILDNIPYKTKSTQNLDTDNVATEYEYRDVGLTIKVKPKILPSNQVYLDLDLSFENILSQTETPSISKKHIKQNLTLKDGELCVLTGINQEKENFNQDAIPMLKDIPFLSWLFKHETRKSTTFNLTILLEVVDSI